MKYNYSICAILSPLEVNYVQEWIDYHKRIGIQHFYLATNDWDYHTEDPSVSTVRLDGRNTQIPYYNWIATNLRGATKWCAFIDGDEFIRCESMDELVKGHEQDDAICLSWRLFGSSGVEFDGRNYSVLERFKMRQVGFNQHIKVVLNLDRVRCADGQLFKCPHFASGVVAKSVDGRAIVGPFDMQANEYLDDNSPYLAHFFTKSHAEWERKRARGRVDVPLDSMMMFRSEQEFSQHDLNEVEDTSLRDVLYEV